MAPFLGEIIEKEIPRGISEKYVIAQINKLEENYLENNKYFDLDENVLHSFISLYTQLARIDKKSKLKLVVFLVKADKKSELEQYHSDLLEEEEFDAASFAASFINHDKIFFSLKQGNLYPKLATFVRSSNNPSQQTLNEMIEGWNSYLTTDRSVQILKN